MKTLIALALCLALLFTARPAQASGQPLQCATTITYRIVEAVTPYGALAVVEETATTCCYDDGNMVCVAVVSYAIN